MNIIEKRKQFKKNNIIKVIRENEDVSRYVLKKKTQYSMTTILNSVTALIEEGLITEEESSAKSVGRTPVHLSINPIGRCFVGIEFNAEKIEAVVMNFAMVIDYSKKYKMPIKASVDEVISLLKEVIAITLEEIEDLSKVEGIGIGTPGYVDKKNGIALQYAYFENWSHIEIRKIIETEFNIPVFIDNNINAMAYHYKREHKEKHDFVIVSMQYGVRLGIVLNDRIFIGNSGNAGEIGHTKVNGGNRKCSCGKRGCLDSEISYLAIQEKVEEYIMNNKLPEIKSQLIHHKFTMEMLGESIRSGDPDAIEILKDITKHLGRKLMTVISVIDIEEIIILNVCDLDNENFAIQVYETIKDYSLDILVNSVHVTSEIVDPFAGAKGSAILVLEEKYGYRKET